MPIPRTEMSRRLMRWMLSGEQPAPLALDHPAQQDLADNLRKRAREEVK